MCLTPACQIKQALKRKNTEAWTQVLCPYHEKWNAAFSSYRNLKSSSVHTDPSVDTKEENKNNNMDEG
jgi:hypothetical protein